MKINKKLNHYIIIYCYFDKIAKFKTKSIRTWFWPLIIYVINFPYSLFVSYHQSKLGQHVTRTFVRRERDKKQKCVHYTDRCPTCVIIWTTKCHTLYYTPAVQSTWYIRLCLILQWRWEMYRKLLATASILIALLSISAQVKISSFKLFKIKEISNQK
jgi:hypothetical protein